MASKVLTRRDLRSHLQEKNLAQIYLLFGEEAYLRNLAVKAITETALKGSKLRDFNEAEFSLNSYDFDAAITSSRQIPMMDRLRVVKITDIVVSASKQKDTLREDDGDTLGSYLENPSESTVLILVANEIDKRRKVTKQLLKHCLSFEFKALDNNELLEWSTDKLKSLGVTAEHRTLKNLIALVGSDARKLTLELEKLATAALPNLEITDELVFSLSPNSRELSNFELADMLLSKNKSGALRVMKKILDDGAEPLMLLGLLSYNFHRLFLAKEMMEEGLDRKEVSRVVRLPYSQQQSFMEAARKTDRGKFSWILQRLAETDLAIKSSIATPRLQIEMLICELSI